VPVVLIEGLLRIGHGRTAPWVACLRLRGWHESQTCDGRVESALAPFVQEATEVTDRILLVEDDKLLRWSLSRELSAAGFEVAQAADGRVGLEMALEADFDLVLCDLNLPELSGMTLLRRLVGARPETFVIMMTGHSTTESAVEALRAGAFDYLIKPLDVADVSERIRVLLSHGRIRREVSRLRRTVAERLGFDGIVGTSSAMRRVGEHIDRVAPTPATVLITGESGTGKELVARAIHTRSDRARKEFLAVNMAAVPEALLESQLFGHEKGAFTGADRRRDGILRAARGGTVFLDEIGEIPPSAQARLLRAIERKEVLPVGADRPIAVDFRLVAATNRDLSAAVADGSFRSDLLYRLDVFGIRLPPLRERVGDIPDLVEHFGRLHARALGRRWRGATNEAMRYLTGYPWPGNVRELSNVLERALILAGGDVVGMQHLPEAPPPVAADTLELRPAMANFERAHIHRVLSLSGGRRDDAAALLGIDRATLYRRLRRLRPAELGGDPESGKMTLDSGNVSPRVEPNEETSTTS